MARSKEQIDADDALLAEFLAADVAPAPAAKASAPKPAPAPKPATPKAVVVAPAPPPVVTPAVARFAPIDLPPETIVAPAPSTAFRVGQAVASVPAAVRKGADDYQAEQDAIKARRAADEARFVGALGQAADDWKSGANAIWQSGKDAIRDFREGAATPVAAARFATPVPVAVVAPTPVVTKAPPVVVTRPAAAVPASTPNASAAPSKPAATPFNMEADVASQVKAVPLAPKGTPQALTPAGLAAFNQLKQSGLFASEALDGLLQQPNADAQAIYLLGKIQSKPRPVPRP